MTLVSVAKQYFRLLKNVGRFTDGQVEIVSWDPDDRTMRINISPNGGLYASGKYEFSLNLPEDFPQSSPRVVCETSIFHPNIDCTDQDHNVCISLFDEWTATNDLQDCIMGLLFLFYNPNLEDPLSPWFDGSTDEADFELEVKRLLRGGEYDGFDFPRFIEDELILDDLRKDEAGASEDEMNVHSDEGYESPENEMKEKVENIKNIFLSTDDVVENENFRHRSLSLDNGASTPKSKPVFMRSVSECCHSMAEELRERGSRNPSELIVQVPLGDILTEKCVHGVSLSNIETYPYGSADSVFVENRGTSYIGAMSLDPLTPELITTVTSMACGFTNYFLHNVFQRDTPVT